MKGALSMLYHASPTPGLTALTPRPSSHGRAYVYAVEDLTTALLFGAKHDDFDFLIHREDGRAAVWECWPGAFRAVFTGKSCSVYEVADDGFRRGVTGWDAELVCEGPVPVAREVRVEDLHSRLLEARDAGALALHLYDGSAGHRALIAGHIVDRLIRFDALDALETDWRFQRWYREIVSALRSAMDGHLLTAAGGDVPREG